MDDREDDMGSGSDRSNPDQGVTRREALAAGLAFSGAVAFRGPLSRLDWLVQRAASVAPRGSDLGAIEHIVFVMQENRSFDHYFGTYRGVRGFDDHPARHLGAFAQPFAHH